MKELTFDTHDQALEFLSLQMEAFLVEAKIIDYQEIPPLLDSLSSLRSSREMFIGYFLQQDNQRDKLVGAISYDVDTNVATIARLVVNPSYFRHGIATALLHHVFQLLQQIEVHQVFVLVASDNLPAMKLYSSVGFEFQQSMIYHNISLSTLQKKIDF